jgi:hypothetical protein
MTLGHLKDLGFEKLAETYDVGDTCCYRLDIGDLCLLTYPNDDGEEPNNWSVMFYDAPSTVFRSINELEMLVKVLRKNTE